MRPIDADALFAAVDETFSDFTKEAERSLVCAVVKRNIGNIKYIAKSQPTLTLDDLRPKGRWVVVEEGPMSTHTDCSVCDEEALSYWDEGYNKRMYFLTPLCPFCGADMQGGGEDE